MLFLLFSNTASKFNCVSTFSTNDNNKPDGLDVHLIQCSRTVSIQSKQQKTLTSLCSDFIEYYHQRNALANFIAKVICLLCGETLGSNLSDDLLLFVLFILFGFPLQHNMGSSRTSPPSRTPSVPQPISEALVPCRWKPSREYKVVTI